MAGCALPWAGEKRNEVNVVFTWQNNQLILEAAVDGRIGEFIVGSAQPKTVLDSEFASRPGRARIVLGQRFATLVSPAIGDLGGIADGILGADAWRDSTLTIDYPRRLVILSKTVDVADHTLHQFAGPPAIPITINGRRELAIIDLALPDTLVLPITDQAVPGQRTRVSVQIGEHDLGMIEAGFAQSSTTRMGNRLLSRFLVQIDYRRGVVALWRDPRSP